MKRPIVIEFSGLPNSGKTTLLHNLEKICKCNNICAIIVQEPAELLPNTIQKGSIAQNFWITLETIQKSLELSFISDVDFILLDRGFYNQLFWATLYKEKDDKYASYVQNFMEEFDKMYHVKPDYLYIVDVDVEESIRRRMNTGIPVTFSKKDFLLQYRSDFEKFAQKINHKFYIDTTNFSKDEVAEIVFNTIIKILDIAKS